MRIPSTSDLSDDDLHLLYLDWCSSQVARRFIELSDDEVWLRSHSVTTHGPIQSSTPDDRSLPALDRIPGYLDLVRKTALLLADELNLPAFPEWKLAYLRDPTAYQVDILGG